jgi:hypothetical protein
LVSVAANTPVVVAVEPARKLVVKAAGVAAIAIVSSAVPLTGCVVEAAPAPGAPARSVRATALSARAATVVFEVIGYSRVGKE